MVRVLASRDMRLMDSIHQHASLHDTQCWCWLVMVMKGGVGGARRRGAHRLHSAPVGHLACRISDRWSPLVARLLALEPRRRSSLRVGSGSDVASAGTGSQKDLATAVNVVRLMRGYQVTSSTITPTYLSHHHHLPQPP
jgi:hypothetical protein